MTLEETEQRFQKFYSEDIPKLRKFTKPIPESKNLIKKALELKLKIILATNPMFLEIALRERLKWANLNYDDFFYISHAENSTSSKPNPKYYANLLKITGTNPENTLMVSNDYLLDMSAKSVGINTWLVDQNLDNNKFEGKFKIDYRGSLSALINYLKNNL